METAAPRSAPRRASCCTTSKPAPPAAAGVTIGPAEAGMSSNSTGQELGILNELRLQAPEPGGQRAAERPAGRLTGGEEDADLVVAEPVSGNSLCRVDGGH